MPGSVPNAALDSAPNLAPNSALDSSLNNEALVTAPGTAPGSAPGSAPNSALVTALGSEPNSALGSEPNSALDTTATVTLVDTAAASSTSASASASSSTSSSAATVGARCVRVRGGGVGRVLDAPPPTGAEALSDFVLRGVHPDDEEASSGPPSRPGGAWLDRTPLQRALGTDGGGWLAAYMIAAGGVSWRALAQQMVERPEWQPGLCASACIPWGSDLARSLMNACLATWMALPGGTRLEDVLGPSAELVRHHAHTVVTDVERTSMRAEGVEEHASGGGGAALLAATALKAGPYALAVRLLAGCATG